MEMMSHSPENTQGEKFEQLFGHSFEIHRIEDGDVIPVGGKSRLESNTDIMVTVDLATFHEWLEEVKLYVKSLEEQLKTRTGSPKFDIDASILAPLLAFSKKYAQTYPRSSEASKQRLALYFGRMEGDVKLSDVFGANSAECVEIGILAQAFLQQLGISSSYFNGAYLRSRQVEFASPHAFIVIRDEGKVYIYDPAQPVFTGEKYLPNISTVEADFDSEVRQLGKAFVTAQHIVTKEEHFYGVSDGTNINPEKHII